MNITELDEFQGLTAEMVREWLLANQWEPCGSSAAHLYYQCGSGEISEALLHEDLGWVVDLLAQSYERSVQSILREINPRMRKGMPSQAAREAHGFKGGMWVGSRGEAGSGGTLVFVSFDDSSSGLPLTVWDFSEFDTWEVGQSEIDNEWLFWPADEHGNKTRWPTDAEGSML